MRSIAGQHQLTVEALVMREEWVDLFTDPEIQAARQGLGQSGAAKWIVGGRDA